MGLFGKILATPFKIMNAPIRAAEEFMDGDKPKEEDRVLSKPLDFLSKEIEKIDE